MKPGYKTTEFYMAVAGVFGIFIDFIRTNCSLDETKLLALFGIIGTYIISRAFVKTSAMKNLHKE